MLLNLNQTQFTKNEEKQEENCENLLKQYWIHYIPFAREFIVVGV